MTALIFVQERQIATALAALLNNVAAVKSSLCHLKVGYAVGGSTGKMFKEPGVKVMLEMQHIAVYHILFFCTTATALQ